MRHFGDVKAVDGVDLQVNAGEVFGFLGPNGAGKSTTVRMLTTLLRPTAGVARVAGFDVVKEADQVRRRIGVALQDAAIDPLMTGHELLALQAVLYGIPKSHVHSRSHELLERVGLTGAADRRVGTYSGGMRRRLDLALSLIHQPTVLFLDEPTTGLDPMSRLALWEEVRRLNAEGTTVLLTTQYLEEADRLAGDIAVVDHGSVIARGTADELKRKVGGERLDVVVAQRSQLEIAAATLRAIAGAEPVVDARIREIRVPVRGIGALTEAVRRFDEIGLEVLDIALHRPSLDDVFLALTGHTADAATNP